MKKLLLTLSIAMLSATAYAAETDLSAKWDALDMNTDGVISKEEVAANPEVASNWDEIDLNQDGSIDTQEFVDFYSK